MKLKTLVLMAASAIGFNANGLDLSNYQLEQVQGIGVPTVLNNGFLANDIGGVYKLVNGEYTFQYRISDGALSATDGLYALGYDNDDLLLGGGIYLCSINECDQTEKRIYINDHKYNDRDSLPYLAGSNGVFSGFGNAMVISRKENDNNYTASVIDFSGTVLDSFSIDSKITYGNYRYNKIISISRLTHEKDFKIMYSNHGEYDLFMKKWNSQSNALENISISLLDGRDVNDVYATGIAPIYIGDPVVKGAGLITYKAVFGKLVGINSHPIISSVVWGDLTITGNKAKFVEELKETNIVSNVVYLNDNLRVNYYPDNKLTFFNQILDLSKAAPEALKLIDNGHLLENKVHYVSSTGEIMLSTKNNTLYQLYKPKMLELYINRSLLDPYLNADFNVVARVNSTGYFGIEANCTLQTTNATVNSNAYVPLSETALQIPIEWDSLTGEWKGAQSLTGLESISGSKEFAKFDLTADVTTGTWSMNCSGIASDIEGNKIQLNPAEITINLDDQIHGGANVISGQISIPNTQDYSGVVVTITLNGRQIEVTTQEDGTFEFDRLVAGDYKVHVYSDQYVAACTDLTLSAENTNPVLNIPMYAGDINNDGGVDIGDFSLLSSLFGLNADDESFNPLADLNHDDVINVQDLSILGSHFGTDHCEVAPQ